ncbi:IclR family transcriptional regulator [Halopenitus persicus]|uniref:IclR family transcriptional regulator n=1 Tax=Halopenitus persicus TaxID=1048396 RepID=UPI000BBA8EA5|nr:IclR family transcriptional regulator [Halopenitus persicus]
MPDQSDSRRIGAVQRTCEILTAMRTQDGSSVSELSDRVDLSVGAVHTHLATLREYGLVVKEGTTYRLGPQLVPFGEFVKHHSSLYQAARPELDELAAETGECAHLLVENNGLSVFLYEAFGDNAVGTSYHVRSRTIPPHHLHYHASGKALLAHYPADRVDEIVAEHGLEPATEETITDRETLRSTFETIRERGYALNDEEEIRGIRAVGAPILDEDDEPVGAISFSAPRSRLQGERFTRAAPERLLSVANVIEVNLQTGDYPTPRDRHAEIGDRVYRGDPLGDGAPEHS